MLYSKSLLFIYIYIYIQSRHHIKKQRLYFATKVLSSQGYGFSSSHVWMWELKHKEGWVSKTWCFWIVVLEKTLESPLGCREILMSILMEISPECSLEGLMLKLKLQYFGHLMRRADSFEKTLILWKTEGRGEGDDRGWDGWMASLTQWTWVWVNSGSWWWTGRPGVLQSMGLQRVGHDWVNWTDTAVCICCSASPNGSLPHPFSFDNQFALCVCECISV